MPSRPGSSTQLLIALLVTLVARPPVAAAAAPGDWLTTTALGASGPKVGVLVVSLDAKAAAQQGLLEGAAEDALVRAARFTVRLDAELLNPGAADKRDQALADATAKIKAGKTALEELDNVKATESFTAAVELLQQQGDLARDFPALLDAWTMKAAGHATGGENAPAKKDIEAVINLNPKAEFSPTYFPPDLLKYAEQVRKLAVNARGELLVRTEPAGARVWVDGTFRGISPVTVAGLTASKHFVTASLGGYALGQTQAAPGEEVLSLAGAELGPGWKKAVTDIKKDPEGSTRDQAAQALGKAAQLDQLLLVVAKKSTAGEKLELIGLRLEVKDQHNAAFKSEVVSATDPEQLTAFFDALTGRDDKRDGKNPVHHFKGGGGGEIKRIASISLLGLAAASLVNGIVFGILASGKAAEWKVTPQTRSFQANLIRQDGQTFAAVADVSYLVAIIAGGVGGTLLLTDLLGGGGGSSEPVKDKSDDKKRRDAERRAAEERRASEERAKEDERRREEEKKREEERRAKKDAQKDADAKAAEEKKKAEEEEAAKKKAEDEEKANKKLSKKELRELERKKKEEEKAAKKEEEKRAAEEKKKQEAEEKANSGKLTKKQREEEERKKKEEEEAAAKKKAEDEARAKKEEEEKKKREEEERKKKEAEEKKKKDEDHDDLRNY